MKQPHTGSNTAGGNCTPRVQSLLHNHIDLARFACNAENNVFWVLDLEDEKAVNIALGFKDRADIEARRDAERDSGNIAAMTITSSLDLLNWYRRTVQQCQEVPDPGPDHIYLILCTEGRFITAKLPCFATPCSGALPRNAIRKHPMRRLFRAHNANMLRRLQRGKHSPLRPQRS